MPAAVVIRVEEDLCQFPVGFLAFDLDLGAASGVGADLDGVVFSPVGRERFGEAPSVTTGNDGSFALSVHPSTTWTLSFLPSADDRRFHVTLPNVDPGRHDIELRLTEAQLAGCVVELFETEPNASAYGQGRRSLGIAIATGGTATFVFRDDVTDPYGLSS